jgi:hypothetical protein
MRLLPARERAPKPWKNGGGVTYDVAVAPPGAGLDDFDWRVSFAEVASEGPFSIFAGVDRTLTLARGAGMTLIFGQEDGQGESETARMLTLDSPPLAFPGDVPVSSRLAAGPILDLNVMTRRGALSHRVRRIEAGETPLRASAPVAFLACLTGEVELTQAGRAARLGPLDLADVSGGPTEIAPSHGARLVLIEIVTARS